jgi:phospholipid/cholesterol/gamma-HCH transport system substrate-binding protein
MSQAVRSFKTQSLALQVGIFTTISLLALAGVLYWLKGKTLQQGEPHDVYFSDVDGLRSGAPVQLMGLRIGFVEAVSPHSNNGHYQVKVRFRINEQSLAIPRGSTISIEQSGLITEKLIEITPPRLLPLDINTQVSLQPLIAQSATLPVKLQTANGPLTVGRIERVDTLKPLAPTPFVQQRHFNHYRLQYRLTTPGAVLPDFASFTLKTDTPSAGATPYLYITSSSKDWRPPHLTPKSTDWFTVLKPIKLKEFFDIQIASAEALKTTNDKINQLLDEETMVDIQHILANVRTLSNQASGLISTTDQLFSSLNGDINQLVKSSSQLTVSLSQMVSHVDALVADPVLQTDLKQAVASLAQSSKNLNTLLTDPAVKNLLNEANTSLSMVNQVSLLAKDKLQKEQLTSKLETNLTLLETTLSKVNAILGEVETATTDITSSSSSSPLTEPSAPTKNQPSGNSANNSTIANDKSPAVKAMVQDARVTLQNLRRFSEKLRGRFVLWKLLF